MDVTRRELGKLALAALPGATLVHALPEAASAIVQATAKPTSVINGVQIGVIAPYSFMADAPDIDSILKSVVQLGINAIELQSEPLEAYAGAPGSTGAARGAAAGRGAGRAAAPAASSAETGTTTAATTTPASPPLTPEQQAAATLRTWRIAQPMEKFSEIKKKFDEAGVAIQIVKFPLGPAMTDDEVDYCFRVARTLGVRAMTCEPPVSETKRLGLFADKHQIRLGFHGHADVTGVESFGRPGAWEQAFFYSKWNGANIDIGHFTAGNNRSPLSFIREYHDRITNIHLKDRKIKQGPNVPWGEGDTEIRQILQLMKREQYTFQATIELEYPVPPGSTRMAEIAKCLAYCKDALGG